MADLSQELKYPQCPQSVPPESQTMTKLAETVAGLCQRMAALEARLAPKPRRVNSGARRTGWRPGRHRFGFRPHSKIRWRLRKDFEEQQTINIIRQAWLDDPTVGPRAICTYLDNFGRRRRNGKKWADGGHSLVAAILKRLVSEGRGQVG